MTTSAIFTIDAGGTASRGRLYDPNGEVLAAVKGPAANAWWGIPQTIAAIHELWHSIAGTVDAASAKPQELILVAAIAGTEHPETKSEILANLDAFPNAQIVSDGYAALIGAIAGQPGALVITGTGTIAHRLLPDGRCITLGGWGAVAGDQGGGAWTGLTALRQWLLWRDGLLPEFSDSSLTTAIAQLIGRSRPEVYLWLAKAKPADYATLAPIVWQAATTGDSQAQRICRQAVTAVGDMIYAVAGRPPECPVYLAGGLASQLRPRLRQDHKLEVLQPVNDANYGAFLIGAGEAPSELLHELPVGTTINHTATAESHH